MEKRFINRDFEQYLRENADQYRMIPSEQVWENIHQRLHNRRRWYAIGLALLLFTTAAVTALLFLPAGRTIRNESYYNTPASTQKQTKAEVVAQRPLAMVENPTASTRKNAGSLTHKLFPAQQMEATELDLVTSADVAALPATIVTNEEQAEAERVTAIRNERPNMIRAAKTARASEVTEPSISHFTRAEQAPLPLITVTTENRPTPTPDNRNKERTDLLSYSDLPTIESVTGMYRRQKIRKRVAWQVFATPTITYRKLKENKDFLNRARTAYNLPTNYSFADINSIVTHKPDMGIQFGFGAAYPVSKKLRIVSGLQINVSKYDIRAYNTSSEVATIALSTDYGGTNTLSTITNYRNIGGYKADWLHNMYVSASAPLGLELNLSGPGKAAFGIIGTLQPSYVLGNRAYLLSADFKNYAEIPSLTRKWNLNTAFEAFAAYNTKKISWRIGPQVRYQVFSSFVKQYPISEHLFDVGVKLGVSIK